MTDEQFNQMMQALSKINDNIIKIAANMTEKTAYDLHDIVLEIGEVKSAMKKLDK